MNLTKRAHATPARAPGARRGSGPRTARVPIGARAEAERRWKTVLRHAPNDRGALEALAENALARGDLVRMDRLLEELKDGDVPERRASTAKFRAWHAIAGGDVDAGLARWREAVGHGAMPPWVTARTVNMLLAASRPDAARSCLEAAGPDASASPLGRLLSAKCLVRERRWTEAAATLQDLESFGERRTAATDLLYRCYINDQRHECAEALCRSLDPETHPDALHMLGTVQYRAQRFEEAIDSFTRDIDKRAHADSRVWLIRTLYAIREHDDAEARAAMEVATEGADPLVRARCWEAAGKLDLAEREYRAAARGTTSAPAWLGLARFHLAYRDWAAALRAVLEARRAGVEDASLDAIRARLDAGFRATGTRVPRSRRGLARFEFRSSERMVDAVVDRCLASPPRPVPGAARRGGSSRIAIVINSLGPGGAERQAVNLANGLVAGGSNDDVRILCTHLGRVDQDRFYLPQVDAAVTVSEYYDRTDTLAPGEVPELAAFADLLEHVQPDSRRQLLLHLARSLAALRPDVVHGWLDETFVNVSLVCRMLGIRTVVGRWGSMPPGVDRTVTEIDENNIDYLRSAYRSIARLPGLVYSSNSRLTADAYAALLGVPPRRVNVVYNGIDEDRLARDARECDDLRVRLGIPSDTPVIGTVFRMSEEKRPLLWLDVAECLARERPELHFVVVGTGPMEPRVVERVAGLRTGNVHLVGKQSNVGAWFALFDVFLLTSRVEGVSNAVVEAQFCGCPVVAPDVGGLSEAMERGRTGYLLDDDSVESFAGAVRALVDDPALLRAMSAEAIEFARDKFSVPSMVAAYRHVFASGDAS